MLAARRWSHNPSHHVNVATIAHLKTPSNVSQLCTVLLGLCSYYRCYLPHFISITNCLNKLLSIDVPWAWTPEHATAAYHQQLKDGLCQEGNALRRFLQDPVTLATTTVYADWIGKGICALLAQTDVDGKEHVWWYASLVPSTRTNATTPPTTER
jgi:hypothetical protein